ncbi:MAG TPA: DNA ligase D [Gemmatimonadaceae bacterium]|nr:DNA ligase D [Gemmatimonadaceae bacterium]
MPSSSRVTPDLEPMYATTAAALPVEGDWVFEPKYDGVRVLAHASPTTVRLVTRNGRDKAAQFPEVVAALRELARRRRRRLVLDGEIVALEGGEPARFQALQDRMHLKGAADVARRAEAAPAALLAFDLLADGDDVLLDAPWRTRRRRLARVVGRRPPAHLRLGETLEGGGDALLRHARRAGWEGLMAKRADAPYRPGARSRDWRKLKVERRQEFVVGGWTEPRRTRPYLGALLLGYHDADGRLVYAGHAGGGFTHQGLREMRARLERLARRTSPFADPPHPNETVHWVRPSVVVEVRFNEWTADGRLRQPIILGVRDDKPPREVVREPESVQNGERRAASVERRGNDRRQAASSDDAHRRRSGTPRKSSRKSTRTSARKRSAAGRAGEDVVAQLERIEAEGGDGTLVLTRGVTLDVSSLGKIFFPEPGYTKGDLFRYYARVSPVLLPILADRPLVLRRYPNGVEGSSFFQQNAPEQVPDAVRVETIHNDAGEAQRRFVGGDLGTLLYAVQLGAISMDPWNARVGSLDRVDYAILDLDPGDGVPFRTVVAVARLVRAALDDMGLTGRLKTSGKSGLHVYLPPPRRAREADAVALAREVAERVAADHPDVATVERRVEARPAGTVYVDYLQNIIAKPVAAAYCVRATPEATVSTPLAWDELTDDLDPRAFTIATVPERLARLGDLWARRG